MPEDTLDSLEIRLTINKGGTLVLSLEKTQIPEPGEHDVVVRVEASPINPSDLGLLFGPADMSTAKASGTARAPIVSAAVPSGLMKLVDVRVDQSMPVGNEGAGVVVKAGASDAAQALLGKTVAVLAGQMYSQYRTVHAQHVLVMPEDTAPAECASCFVNPLTALGMVETMKLEGHSALVHTAAASNLGQMLQKLCLADGVELVNIVRKPEQAEVLKAIGATHVCDSSEEGFSKALTDALVETGATIAFDATGGGNLTSRILTCMEIAANKTAGAYSRYGSTTHKQVYIYGGLERSQTQLDRSYGMAWGLGGWLLTPFLKKIGFEAAERLRQRVAAEVKTTFASSYGRQVSLAEALSLDAIADYGRMATGAKTLINPSK